MIRTAERPTRANLQNLASSSTRMTGSRANPAKHVARPYGLPEEVLIDNGREALGATLRGRLAELGVVVIACPASNARDRHGRALLRELSAVDLQQP